jgi:hypothetical protein
VLRATGVIDLPAQPPGMGATAGLAAGLVTTLAYMLWTIDIYGNGAGIFGIPETGFGTVGMVPLPI